MCVTLCLRESTDEENGPPGQTGPERELSDNGLVLTFALPFARRGEGRTEGRARKDEAQVWVWTRPETSIPSGPHSHWTTHFVRLGPSPPCGDPTDTVSP